MVWFLLLWPPHLLVTVKNSAYSYSLLFRWFLDALLYHSFLLYFCVSREISNIPHNEWEPGWCHTLQPCTPPRSIMVCLMQGETSIIRVEAETTVKNTKERGRAGTGRNWLCCRLAPLIQTWWQFDGCTWGDMGLCIRVYIRVYIISMVFTHSPPTLFFFTLKGDFPVASCFGKSN